MYCLCQAPATALCPAILCCSQPPALPTKCPPNISPEPALVFVDNSLQRLLQRGDVMHPAARKGDSKPAYGLAVDEQLSRARTRARAWFKNSHVRQQRGRDRIERRVVSERCCVCAGGFVGEGAPSSVRAAPAAWGPPAASRGRCVEKGSMANRANGMLPGARQRTMQRSSSPCAVEFIRASTRC